MNEISFTKVRLPYGWLGNMSPHAVTHAGRTWRTTEALFQALRFPEMDEVRALIHRQTSPMAAKMMAKTNKHAMVIVPMSDLDVENMRMVLRLKLTSHPELVKQLDMTGDAQLIEDCSNRQHGTGLFWGAARQLDGSWKGENTLGKLWMEIRKERRL